jgi:peptidyl-prolyl cis-trans isomerase D
MLDAMRRGAVNWLAKILLGLLIVAFALWGVADVFRNYGRGTLARLGNTEISVDEYRQAYQEEMASIPPAGRPPPHGRTGQDARRRATDRCRA